MYFIYLGIVTYNIRQTNGGMYIKKIYIIQNQKHLSVILKDAKKIINLDISPEVQRKYLETEVLRFSFSFSLLSNFIEKEKIKKINKISRRIVSTIYYSPLGNSPSMMSFLFLLT